MAFNRVLCWPNTGGCIATSIVLEPGGGGGKGIVTGGWITVDGGKCDVYTGGGGGGGGAMYGDNPET